MADRFKVVEGSQSGHCCFDWTVVDLAKPYLIHGVQHDNRFDAVCECFYEEDALKICNALNLTYTGVDADQSA